MPFIGNAFSATVRHAKCEYPSPSPPPLGKARLIVNCNYPPPPPLPHPTLPSILGQLNGLLEQQEKDRRERRARIVSGADLINALRQQRRELESKCASASDRLRKTREETSFLWVGLVLMVCDPFRSPACLPACDGCM